MIDPKLPKVYIVGKDEGRNTGLYKNGKLVEAAKEVIIIIKAGEINKARIVFNKIKYYWKDNKWNRRITEKSIDGFISSINQGISIPEEEFKELDAIEKTFRNFEKSFEK